MNENEIGFCIFKEQIFEIMQIESQEEYLREPTYQKHSELWNIRDHIKFDGTKRLGTLKRGTANFLSNTATSNDSVKDMLVAFRHAAIICT